jgi:hypothetical protein
METGRAVRTDVSVVVVKQELRHKFIIRIIGKETNTLS